MTPLIGRERDACPRKEKNEGRIGVEDCSQAPSRKIHSSAAAPYNGMDEEGDDNSEYYDNYDGSTNLFPVYNDDRLSTASRDKRWACFGARESERDEGGGDVSMGKNDRKRKFQPPSATIANKDNPRHESSIRRVSHPRRMNTAVAAAAGAGIHDCQRRKDPSVGENLVATAPQHGAAESAKGWTEEMHRQLVEAIYEIGVSQASPLVIMEHMTLVSTATEALDGPDSTAASDLSYCQPYLKIVSCPLRCRFILRLS